MMDKARIAAIAGALSCISGAAGYAGRATYPEEHTGAAPAPRPTAAVPTGSSPWALYGRQQQMSLRGTMQRRETRRAR